MPLFGLFQSFMMSGKKMSKKEKNSEENFKFGKQKHLYICGKNIQM